MMAASLEQAVHTNLECPVCRRFFKDPKILPCSHTFCKGCLENLLARQWRKDVLLCPTCEWKTLVPGGNVGGLQSNITVKSLVEAVETQGHSNCIPNYDERLCFRSQHSNGLQLVQRIRQKESKWVLRMENLLPDESTVKGMAISPTNKMAVVCGYARGIVVYSSQGIKEGTVLENVVVWALDFMPHTGYVIRDSNNNIFRYTDRSEKFDVKFETMEVAYGRSGGLTVDKDGFIFVGYLFKKIQVFRPEGGKAIREIMCSVFLSGHIFAMKSSQAIIVSSLDNKVLMINDVSGAPLHSISKVGERPFPAVYQDDSIIIAWVKDDLGLLSIVQYKKEPNKCIKNILTDFRISGKYHDCFLQAFKTGEIAFCTSDRLYIFHETWE